MGYKKDTEKMRGENKMREEIFTGVSGKEVINKKKIL